MLAAKVVFELQFGNHFLTGQCPYYRCTVERSNICSQCLGDWTWDKWIRNLGESFCNVLNSLWLHFIQTMVEMRKRGIFLILFLNYLNYVLLQSQRSYKRI